VTKLSVVSLLVAPLNLVLGFQTDLTETLAAQFVCSAEKYPQNLILAELVP
jgi:hypothetical protein